MTANPCLVLFGNPVFLAGIKTGLEGGLAFELVRLKTRLADELVRVLYSLANNGGRFGILLMKIKSSRRFVVTYSIT